MHTYSVGEDYELSRDLDFRPFGTIKMGTAFRVSCVDTESNIIDLVPHVPVKELHQMEQVLCLVPGLTTELETSLIKRSPP